MRVREAESKPTGVEAEREQPASLNVHSLSREGIPEQSRSQDERPGLLTPGKASVVGESGQVLGALPSSVGCWKSGKLLRGEDAFSRLLHLFG